MGGHLANELNLGKCELVRITNKKYPLKYRYCLQDKQIKSVPNVKYLGIVIDVYHLMIM